jgi:hypothetical protein
VAAISAAFLVVVGVVIFVALYYVGAQSSLPVVAYTASAGQVNVVLQEDPQNNSASKPDWVTYYVQNPVTHEWQHTTLFSVPAHTRVNVTIYGYDGCTPLRNNFWSQVLGTIGGTVNVQQFNKGRPLGPARNTSVINSWAGCNVAHTFAIPNLGVFVPVASPSATATLCSSSPCTPASGAYSLEKFSFMSPAHTGIWRWQCLIPCGGGYIDGNGGPMQTVGYMTGEMTVTG